MTKSKQIIRNKYLLTLFTCLLTLSFNPQANSQTRSEAIIVAQNFLNTDYSSGYYAKMLEGDRFYKQGDLQKVRLIQQLVKPEFPAPEPIPAAESDLSKLDATARQHWDSANQALKEKIKKDDEAATRIFEPLESLVDNYPQFVPGHILLAKTYDKYDWEEDALNTIEYAAGKYPDNTDILDTKIDLLLNAGQYLEASIAAREYAYSNPDAPQASAYSSTADKYFRKYKKKLKSKITTSSILGGIGQAFMGKEERAVDLASMLIDGESATGSAFVNHYKEQYGMVSDPVQLEYIRGIGNKLAKLMGRDEFDYEFYIIEDPSPNAFALPGGKIFLHTGMLELIDSEAELAGVMAHEIAHSVLSHSYQKIGEAALTNTGRNLISNFAGKEVGSIASVGEKLLNQSFSRDKEKQADILGLRVLDAAGYSADGLYNVMAKLAQLDQKGGLTEALLSSHPASEKRMEYLEELIQNKGYNRFGYEGVAEYRNVFSL